MDDGIAAVKPFRIFDADAHVIEPGVVLEEHIEAEWQPALMALPKGRSGFYGLNAIPHKRRLGSSEEAKAEGSISPVGSLSSSSRFQGREPRENCNTDPQERILDMDLEGTDVAMILPSGLGSFCTVEDPDLESAVYRAYHRYMREFCAPFPDRLTGVVVAGVRDLDASIMEVKRAAEDRWAVALLPVIAPGTTLDSPVLDQLWATAAELDLTIALHTTTTMPPYAPGVADGSLLENSWLARSAAHPWCGMRNMAAFLGSGAMDRHPTLRVATLEAGHGWLPYWLMRLDEQAEYMRGSLAADARPMTEYVRSGRYFQSVEVAEGEAMTRYVTDQVGPDVLMFTTDYPHGAAWFPNSVREFLSWEGFSAEERRKLAWDNALRCFPRCAG